MNTTVQPSRIGPGPILLATGLAGVASLLLAPIGALVPVNDTGLSDGLLRVVLMVQPAILVLLAAVFGTMAARRVGLDAPIVRALAGGGDWRTPLKRVLAPAIGVGLAAGIVMLAQAGFGLAELARIGIQPEPLPLATRLLHGAVAGEVMLRWGAMSVIAFGLWHLAGRPDGLLSGGLGWMAVTITAAFNVVLLLPALFSVAPAMGVGSAMLLLVGAALPAIGFGWLFWRRGIEAAITAHLLALLLASLLQPLL